ncbi:enoyl-CoA hydratase [Marinicauda salina]|uniref:Enoyl-CoA hydratase n=1 Tax=Marinicauda salina TaxID=2135793 RepID=A0A2U2BWV7_9PROT|nr:bifunctional enoyl-CoA hydratase/phosphate acetyltransferase [Marinicauda salina]PWE18506.1 enoyl-CoA hydratase [Marinicauda salina]
MDYYENRTYDELETGEHASLTRTLSADDIEMIGVMAGAVTAPRAGETGVDGAAMWTAGLVVAALSVKLPGPGTTILGQDLEFGKPVAPGDAVTVEVRVLEKGEDRRVRLAVHGENETGETVVTGEVEVAAPAERARLQRQTRPQVFLHEQGLRLKGLIERARRYDPVRTAVVHPVDDKSLGGALAAAEAGLVEPVLVGPRAKIEAAAKAADLDISALELVDAPHSHAAAARAVAMAREGAVAALMKGALHTDEIMGEVVSSEHGLRTERRISHVMVTDAPAYPKLLLITDAAINIAPDLEEKRDIVQNAIDLARALDIAAPKVAILAAIETVYPRMRSTVEAAALCKMADRGQITGGALDGPLAFDNAVSPDAAQTKGLDSPVAGQADILVAPDIEAGNILVKQLDYLAGATAAGVVMGARVPIILTSRSEGVLPRVAASAVAQLYVNNKVRPAE